MKINQSNREDPRRIFSLHLWGVCCAVALLMLGASATLGATLNVPSQYSTIQAAINAANNGDTVQVAAGTYHEHLQVMNKTIALLGAGAQTTIVDASDSIDNRCLYLYQVGSATRVEGFTFQGARSNIIRGGGIMIGGACSPTVANNIITANSAKRGGGICIDTSCSPTLTNNTITDNSALEEGGGVWTGSYSSPVLTNNTIDGNYASQSGGGVYFSRSSATLTGNTIAHNEVAEGGKGAGFYENYGSPTLTNNTITDNRVGEGYYLEYGELTLVNNTIAWNSANGLENHSPSQLRVVVTNCILWGNWGEKDLLNASATYSCVGTGSTAGTGNISVDPLFADPWAGDFHLKSKGGRWTGSGWVMDTVHSPCIDAGNPASAYDNEPLPNGGRINMGAFGNTEQASKSWFTTSIAVQSIVIAPGLKVDLTATLTAQGQPLPGKTLSFSVAGVPAGSAITDASGVAVKPYTVSQGPGTYQIRAEFAGEPGYDASSGTGTLTVEARSEVWVDDDWTGPGNCGGHTWRVDAFNVVQDAIIGVLNPGTVHVLAGTYPEYLTWSTKSLALLGAGPDLAVIDAEWRGHCLAMTNVPSSARVEGFTFTRGVSDDGGGLYCNQSSPTIQGNIIRNNWGHLGGGGIYCRFSSPTIRNNTLSGNTSSSYGGGIYCDQSSPTIVNNVLTGNSARSGGGGIYCLSASPRIVNNTLVGNSSTYRGGGIDLFYSASRPSIQNCIIAFSSEGSGISVYQAQPSIAHCDVYGNAGGNYQFMNDPTGRNGNISADPLFVDRPAGDYHLQEGSPCIDTGTNDAPSLPEEDFEGEPRVQSGIVDMGADESPYSGIADAGPDQTVEQATADGTDVQLDGSGSTDPDGDDLYAWDVDGDGEYDDAFGPTPTVTLNLGEHVIGLKVTDPDGESDTDAVTITVVDTTAPTLNLPANITGVEQTSAGGAYVNFEVTATDICDAAPVVLCVPESGSEFPLGPTTVSVTATDASGNEVAGMFTVTVVDTTDPTITAPPDVTVQRTTPEGTPKEQVDLGEPTVSDLCDTAPSVSNDAPDVFPPGETVVTWMVSDDSGNIATDTQIVTVDQPPTADAGPDLTVPATEASGALVTLDGSASSDPDGDALTYKWREGGSWGTIIAGPSTDPTAQVRLCIGQHIIELIVDDGRPGTSTDTVLVTVTDPTGRLSISGRVTRGKYIGTPFPSVVVTARSQDGTVTEQAVSGEDGFYYMYDLPAGTYTVTAHKNYVSFEPGSGSPIPAPVVPVPPTQYGVNFRSWAEVMGQPTIVVELPNGGQVWDVGATKTICWTSIEVDPNVTVELSRNGGATYETLFADIADDGQENWVVTGPATEHARIRVSGTGHTYAGDVEVSDVSDGDFTIRDNVPPELTAPEDVTAEQASADGTAVDLGTPTVTDNADPHPVVTNDAPAVFPLGATTVTWTATDASGNSVTVTQKVTIMDTTDPVLIVPPEVTMEYGDPTDPDHTGWATATDVCDAAVVIAYTDAVIGGQDCIHRTWTATDDSGNVATGYQKINLVDTTPPVLTVPGNKTAEQTDRNGTPVDIGQATATDNHDYEVDITNDAPAVFPLGTTTVTWTATDDWGNVATATQTVTVVDTAPPNVTLSTAVTSLWPANHDLVNVGLTLSASDICDADPDVILLVTQDEPVEDQGGDGNFSPDAKILRDADGKITGLRLRAERKGNGDGRVYLLIATVTDASGNVTKKCCAVTVPKSQSQKDKAAVAAQAAAAVAAGVPLAYDSTAGPVVGPKQ